MATLVQQPDVANTQVSQLQAVDAPVKSRSSLSDFIVAALPVAKVAVDTLQEESRQHNLALGMNDELNNVTRAVSWIDQQSYKEGRNIQTISAAMAGRDTAVADTIYKRLTDNPDLPLEDVLREYEEGNKAIVDSIFEMEGSLETKEKLFEAQLQAHAQQVKAVQGVYERVGMETDVKGRRISGSAFFTGVLTAKSPQDVLLSLGRLESEARARVARLTTLKPSEREAQVQEEIKANFETTLKLLRENTTPDSTENIKQIQHLNAAFQSYIYQPDSTLTGVNFSTFVDLNKEANSIIDDLHAKSEENASLQSTIKYSNVDTGAEVFTVDMYNAENDDIAAKYANGTYSAPFAEAQYRRNNERMAKAAKQLAAAEGEAPNGAQIIANNIPRSQWNLLADLPVDSSSEYNKAVTHAIMSKHDNTTPDGRAKTALEGIAFADRLGGDEDNPELRKSMYNLLWNNLTPYLVDPNATSNPNFQLGERNWEILSAQYQEYKKNYPTRTDDLLGGNALTESQRLMMDRVLRDGGTLKQAVSDFQRSGDFAQDVSTFKTTVATWDDDDMNVSDYFGTLGQRSGYLSNLFGTLEAGDRAKRDKILAVQTRSIIRNSQNSAVDIASEAGLIDPDQMIAYQTRKGMILPAKFGYNAVTVNSAAAKRLAADNEIPSDSRTDANAGILAGFQINYAKERGLEPSNVFITSLDGNGNKLYIRHLNSKGVFSDQPVPLDIDVVRRAAVKRYREKLSETYEPSVKRTVAGTVAKDGAKPQTYSYKPSATIGQITLTAQDDANKNKKYRVTVPYSVTGPVNGNADLGMKLIEHLGIKEGLHLDIQERTNISTGLKSRNGGLQISLWRQDRSGKWVRNADKKWEDRLKAAKGNPQQIMNIQGDWLTENLAGAQVLAKLSGIPVARQDVAYPKAHEKTQLYIMDLMYHQGTSPRRNKLVVDSLTQPTYSQGLRILESTPAWEGSGSHRRRGLKEALQQHYRNLGKVK